mgnify:CR=1 FL=1
MREHISHAASWLGWEPTAAQTRPEITLRMQHFHRPEVPLCNQHLIRIGQGDAKGAKDGSLTEDGSCTARGVKRLVGLGMWEGQFCLRMEGRRLGVRVLRSKQSRHGMLATIGGIREKLYSRFPAYFANN